MNIYVIHLENFDKNKLHPHIDNKYFPNKILKNHKNLQHYVGLYLIDAVAKNYYNIQNREISYKNGKPYFLNSTIQFNISHSSNIVAGAFDENTVGFDIELNTKSRNYLAILKRYNSESENLLENFSELSLAIQQKKFYEFWTKHEATIKLNSRKEELFYYTDTLNENYTFSIASEQPIEKNKIIILD